MADSLFLQCLKANAHLKIKTLEAPEFKVFGRVHDFKFPQITACLNRLEMPHDKGGEIYIPEDHNLDACTAECAYIRENLYGQVPCQIGSYAGRAYKLNALEYHKCSEILLIADPAVLLLASIRQLDQFTLNTALMQAFYVPAGTCVELYNTTLHFSPLAVTEKGMRQAVVQQQGTNTPKTAQTAVRVPEDELLLERNKWVICHEEADFLVKAGAKVGLIGPNLTLHTAA